jgi:hypothetical protein
MRSARDDLIWTVTYALWEARKLLPRPGKRPTGWGPSLDQYRSIGEAIVDHIERSGYEVNSKPQAPHPTTPGRR